MLAEPYCIANATSPPRLASFTFDIKPISCNTFRFVFPRRTKAASTTTTITRKRHRSLADVDGEGSAGLQKKKRRLRLELVTSRLSQPYATPTTYIISRENIKGTKRLKPKPGSRSLLRRAAIMNWTRHRKAEHQDQKLNVARNLFVDDGSSIYDDDDQDIEMAQDDNTIRRHFRPPEQSSSSHVPHRPSPLGLSNYDAIDMEGDPYDDELWDDPVDSAVESFSSRRDPVDSVVAELVQYSSPHPDAVRPLDIGPQAKDIMELVTNDEQQHEVSFAQFS